MESGLLYLICLRVGVGLKEFLKLFPSQLWLGRVLVINMDTPRKLNLVIILTNTIIDPRLLCYVLTRILGVIVLSISSPRTLFPKALGVIYGDLFQLRATIRPLNTLADLLDAISKRLN
jgi:hypothetical protein